MIQRQVYAAHALKRLWSSDVEEFFQGLAKRFRFKQETAKAVREAARDVLRDQTKS